MLRFMGSQRVRHDLATELNRTENCRGIFVYFVYYWFSSVIYKENDFFLKKRKWVYSFTAKWGKKKCLRRSNKLRIHILTPSQTNAPVTLPVTFILYKQTGKEPASQYKNVFILLFKNISNSNKMSETGLDWTLIAIPAF